TTQTASTTTIASSANPSVLGQPVTFTATVTGSGFGSPTGVVTFLDGSTTIGQAALTGSGGTATASISTFGMGIGGHTITATYSGDGTFLASSGALGQTVFTVSASSSATSLTSSANPQTAGQPVSWTATVAAVTGPVNFVNFETGDFSQVATRTNGALVSS